MAVGVEILGVDAMAADMAKLCARAGPLERALAAAGVQAVAPVAAATRSSLPQISGALVGDVRVVPLRTGASVRMGSPQVRYAGFVDFGGNRKAPRASSRPYLSQGRYLWPHALSLVGASTAAYEAATAKALDGFNWTNSGDTVR